MAGTLPVGAFTQATADALSGSIQTAATGVSFRNLYYCDYAAGVNGNAGTLASPVKDLATAYALCEAGKNDAVVVVSNGASSGFQRLTGTFTWAKASTHLLGMANGISSSTRASIRPASGATAFTPLFTVSAAGCLFQNLGFWSGFGTGTTSQIGLSVTGSYNNFVSCHIVGMADSTSAGSAGSRCLKIGSAGSGENEFTNCTIGVDTVTRTAANASVEFAGGTPRNKFTLCVFRFMGNTAGVLGFVASAAAAMDRDQTFIDCQFINAIKSTSTQMTALSTLAASAGGMLYFKDCTLVGITEFGSDATSLGQIYVDGGTVTAATSGIAVNPS